METKELKGKLIVEFDPENPTHIEFFKEWSEGPKWKVVVSELDEHLRTKIKYAPENMPDVELKAYEEIRETLRHLVSENSLDL